VPEFHVNAPQATVSEELAQGPYVVATAGVEPVTLRTKGVDSSNAPSRPTRPLFLELQHLCYRRAVPKPLCILGGITCEYLGSLSTQCVKLNIAQVKFALT